MSLTLKRGARVYAAALSLMTLLSALIVAPRPASAQDGVIEDNFTPGSITILSPPIVLTPLFECSEAVAITGVVPGATVEVFIDTPTDQPATATTIAQGDPTIVTIPALAEGATIQARQTHDGITSAPSQPVTVAGIDEATFAVSRVDPPPLYACGRRTGSREHVPGANVTLYAQPSPGDGSYTSIGGGVAPAPRAYFDLSPQLAEGEAITTQYELCGIVSQMSGEEVVQPEPPFIPEPTIDEELYEGMSEVWVNGLFHGARFTVYKNGTGSGAITAQGYTGGSRARVRLYAPLVAGDELYASQQLCSSSATTTPTPVNPCSALPAPIIRTPEIGATEVVILDALAGARVQIFDATGAQLGDGGGERVALVRPLRPNDTLFVRQVVGACAGQTWWRTDTVCKKTDVLTGPADDGAFKVGQFDYALGDVVVNETPTRVSAHVRYPTGLGGSDELAPYGGRFPIVFLLHGNHGRWRNVELPEDHPARDICGDEPYVDEDGAWDVEVPNHRGYDDTMNALAKRGVIAVSIDGFDLNCKNGHILERAELILAHMQAWLEVDENGGEFVEGQDFIGRVDMRDVGLLGHSRGGEAVLLAAALARSLFDPVLEAKVSGVIALAPSDFLGYALQQTPLLVILPAADGDLEDNEGARVYDRASDGGAPGWFRSQQYIYGANHNFFNAQWGYDDSLTIPGTMGPALTRGEQEEILKQMARGFFDLTLHGDREHERFLSGDATLSPLPPNIYTSYSRYGELVVDDFENNDLATNTLGRLLVHGGFYYLNEESFVGPGGGYNMSFYHDTRGMLAVWRTPDAYFTEEVFKDVSAYPYLSLRVTQTADPVNQAYGPLSTSVGIELGSSGVRGRISSTEVGPVPYPYDFGSYDRSMMHTLRVPTACLSHSAPEGQVVNLTRLQDITIDTDTRPDGVLGFDSISFTR